LSHAPWTWLREDKQVRMPSDMHLLGKGKGVYGYQESLKDFSGNSLYIEIRIGLYNILNVCPFFCLPHLYVVVKSTQEMNEL